MKRLAAIFVLGLISTAQAVPPDIEYIYPAGARRGTTAEVRVGGCYFHGQAHFEILGQGVKVTPLVKRTKTLWFEGPLIYQPLSQKGENYPKDHLGQVTISKNAALGPHPWRCWTSQGATKTLKFVIGELPEIMENEMDGHPIPQAVTLPVTVNGRIFPREDVDIWSFEAKADETIICDAAAKRFGSPLLVVMAVHGPEGNKVRTQKTVRGGDPIHWFKAPKTGRYRVHIHDAKFWGLQNHIYRLTIKRGPQIMNVYPLGGQRGSAVQAEFTGPGLPRNTATISFKDTKAESHTISIQNFGQTTFVVGEHPEHLEPVKAPIAAPAILNGRIVKPGEIDAWSIKLEETEKITLDLAAARLGSPLDAVLSIHDTEDKQLGTNDDRAMGNPDPRLDFTAPKAAIYTVKIKSRFTSRSGFTFAYRLTVAPKTAEEEKPGFSLSLGATHLNVSRATEPPKEDAKPAGPKLKINAQRNGGFKGEIQLALDGLPKNVKVFNTQIAANKNSTELQFIVPPKTRIAVHRLKVIGTGDLGDQNATQTANHSPDIDHVLLGIAPPVPFKHHGKYRIVTGLPGGTTFFRQYTLERGGFDGPLWVRLADKQIRHLQGVTDRMIEVPVGADEFKYPYDFSARVEVGRTSRLQVMLVGELTDFDGTKHKISYTSNARDDQLISVAAAGLVSIDTLADSFTAAPNSEFTIPFTLRREPAVREFPMKVELIVPQHIKGIFAASTQLAPGQSMGALKIKTANSPGPLNTPFKIRARTATGPRHVAEKKIELVAPLN